jgi:hypothetical protein
MDPSANAKGRTKLNASTGTNPKFYARAKTHCSAVLTKCEAICPAVNKRHQSVALPLFLTDCFLHSLFSIAFFNRLLHSIFRSPFLYFKNIDRAEVTLSRLSLSATISLSSGLIV